jgi:H/ACA ribonucleoprotein complex subunit 1
MSFRGRGNASGANRGGFGGGRGGENFPNVNAMPKVEKANEIFFTGRGGFQQSFGPPAQVLGNYFPWNIIIEPFR